MGGHQVTGAGTGDDGYDEEGYDESQRAEILEFTRDGPSDGLILTDLDPDLGDQDDEDEPLDELEMEDGEMGETDSTVPMTAAAIAEDDLQEDFDEDEIDDEELDDKDDVALRP